MAISGPAPGRGSSLLLLLIGAFLLIGGLTVSAFVQRASGVAVETVYFRGAAGVQMRALLFKPKSASPERRAPAILAFHGYLNTAEMQSNFAIEFARRGYVVLAPDQRGHGGSDPAAFQDGFGGPDALTYLRSLPFVDVNNIGLEGHSMGGWTVLAAARAFPDGYRSMVLEGSSVGAPFAPEGDKRFPRNLMVVFGTYDEFGGFMWGPEAPLRTGATAKAKALFGTNESVVTGRLYGSIPAGTARILETPRVTHPWLHESKTGIGLALKWFGRTLEGGRPLTVSDQVWPYKEIAGGLALIGVVPFVLGVFGLLLSATPFRPLLHSGDREPAKPFGRSNYVGLAAMGLVPVLTYLPLMQLSELLIGQNSVLRQTFTNQLAFWAAINAVLALVAARATGTRLGAHLAQPLRALVLAILVAACLAVVLFLGDRLGHVSPQLWILTWRPLTLARLGDFLIYLPAFAFFLIVTLRTLDSVSELTSRSAGSGFAIAIAALAAPFLLFLTAQYGWLATTGSLMTPTEGLRVIISIPVVPLMAMVALVAVATRRLTKDVLPGALLCSILLTWFITATQPMGVS